MPDPTARYAAHLTAYLEGRTEEAVAGLAAFDDAEVRAISTGRNPVAPVRLPSSGISRQRMLHAVAMLHAECAFALFRHGQHALADRHLTLAGRTVDPPGFGDSGPESFRCRWHLMVLMFANHDEIRVRKPRSRQPCAGSRTIRGLLLEAAGKHQGDAMCGCAAAGPVQLVWRICPMAADSRSHCEVSADSRFSPAFVSA
jgi:hypothetical protein